MSKENQEGLRILKAEIRNFKNISYKEIDIDGRSIIIAGKNGKGKSAMLQALTSPLNSKVIPVEPVKKGEGQGSVEIEIGGFVNGFETNYTVGMVFSAGSSKGRLWMKDATGKSITSGQKGILNQIIGDISFDIMDFLRLGYTSTGKPSPAGQKEQIEILEGLMPKESIKKLYALKRERQEVYDERTDLNRTAKHLEGTIASSNFTPEDIIKYAAPVSIDEISKELTQAQELNSNIDKADSHLESIDKSIEGAKTVMARLKAEYAEKKALIEEAEEKKAKIDAWKEGKVKVDTEAIQVKFSEVSDHNTKHSQINELKINEKKIKELQLESEKKTKRIEQIDIEKKELFTSADMPVKGLEFDDEGITYNGLPLSENQIPSSQLIGIGMRIGMALNPHLKLLTIKDGSLLDDDTMKYVLKVCDEEGYQLLIEVVDSSKDEVTLEFIEREAK
jgi:DNA repair exonuclease SbcCD ATPase subunit